MFNVSPKNRIQVLEPHLILLKLQKSVAYLQFCRGHFGIFRIKFLYPVVNEVYSWKQIFHHEKWRRIITGKILELFLEWIKWKVHCDEMKTRNVPCTPEILGPCSRTPGAHTSLENVVSGAEYVGGFAAVTGVADYCRRFHPIVVLEFRLQNSRKKFVWMTNVDTELKVPYTSYIWSTLFVFSADWMFRLIFYCKRNKKDSNCNRGIATEHRILEDQVELLWWSLLDNR